MERIVAALRRAGELDDTLIVFTSDNGYLLGEHRLPDEKINVYEESVRVPLAMRGPGSPGGRAACRTRWRTWTWRPTIVDAAGAEAGLEMDGRSLLPLARRPGRHMNRADPAREPLAPVRAALHAVHGGARAATALYVEYRTGERELYDLRRDPHQLRNLATPRRRLERDSRACCAILRACHGAECRQARH